MALISAASLQAVFSSLLRLTTYAFLRLIPARIGPIVISSLFAAYFLTWAVDFLSPSARASGPTRVLVEEDEKVEIKPSANGDEVDVMTTDTITVTAIPTSERTSISTILFSLPTSSTPAKLLSLLINVALLGMVLDFAYRPTLTSHDDLTFTRVGAVYHDSAKIVVRYPGLDEGVRIVWKQVPTSPSELDNESGWTDGPFIRLNSEQDWIGVAKVDSLWTSTKYQYRLAAANATLLPYPATPIPFKTFPDPRIPGTKFKFIASSCILPNFPYVPFLPLTRIKGFELLGKQLDAPSTSDHVDTPQPGPKDAEVEVPASIHDPITPREADAPAGPTPDLATSVVDVVESVVVSSSLAAPTPDPLLPTTVPSPTETETEFMILLGDFIYADLPRPALDDREAFLTSYRETYASADFRKVYERLPILNIYDDHEMENDFNGYSNESTPIWANASNAWAAYQGQANYDSHLVDANGHQPYYFDFVHGDVAFFVLDTRRYRSVVGVNQTEGEVPTLLGDKQMSDFTKWVGKVNSTAAFKFVISSVPLTGMWGGPNGQIDTWMGASQERLAFLELLEYVPNVVVISGDRHEFAAVEHLGANTIHEFSISPLSQFYIPYVRTFWPSNAPTKGVPTTVNVTSEDGTIEAQEIMEQVETEKVLKYLPHGNYKWGTFEVDTTNSDAPTVTLELTIDGARAWEYTIVGKPVHWTGSTSLNAAAIADSVTEGVKNVLSRLGRIFG